MTDLRPLHEKLMSRVEVPLNAAVWALQNLLGSDHPLYKEGEEYRRKVSLAVQETRPKERKK